MLSLFVFLRVISWMTLLRGLRSRRRRGLLGFARVVFEDSLRDRLQVPHDAEPRHHDQSVVTEVDLPPEETLASGRGVVVVVVVPAFAEREQGDPEIVAAIVLRRIAP